MITAPTVGAQCSVTAPKEPGRRPSVGYSDIQANNILKQISDSCGSWAGISATAIRTERAKKKTWHILLWNPLGQEGKKPAHNDGTVNV